MGPGQRLLSFFATWCEPGPKCLALALPTSLPAAGRPNRCSLVRPHSPFPRHGFGSRFTLPALSPPLAGRARRSLAGAGGGEGSFPLQPCGPFASPVAARFPLWGSAGVCAPLAAWCCRLYRCCSGARASGPASRRGSLGVHLLSGITSFRRFSDQGRDTILLLAPPPGCFRSWLLRLFVYSLPHSLPAFAFSCIRCRIRCRRRLFVYSLPHSLPASPFRVFVAAFVAGVAFSCIRCRIRCRHSPFRVFVAAFVAGIASSLSRHLALSLSCFQHTMPLYQGYFKMYQFGHDVVSISIQRAPVVSISTQLCDGLHKRRVICAFDHFLLSYGPSDGP
jgi:hypothetical protein